jgi:aryl-alcohol dehydrogenase-like predicted oxidoreductase
MAQGENIIPIPGTKKREKLKDNAGSVDVTLSQDDFKMIEVVLEKYPDTGDRYSEANWKFVDRN